MSKKKDAKTYREILRHEDQHNKTNDGIGNEGERAYLKRDLSRTGIFIIIATIILAISTIIFSDFSFATRIREILGLG